MTSSRTVTELNFDTLQEAWQGINEFLYLDEEFITSRGGGAFGSEMVSFDNHIRIEKAWVDPDYDFGKKLGYSRAKWTSLVNNYCDPRYLDMLRFEIQRREKQTARMYNYTIHFTNRFGSGKDCLVALTIARRPGYTKPVATFSVRTSEVTKRLLFDFLLVQRVIEYLYGHNDVIVNFHAQHFYITAESFIMYNNTNNIPKLWKKAKKEGRVGKPQKFQTKIKAKYKEYMNHPDPHNVMFRVNRRSMLQIQKDENGEPLSGVKSMLAKDLQLKDDIKYPPEVITRKDQLRHNRNKKKEAKK